MKDYKDDLEERLNRQSKRWDDASKEKTVLAQLGMIGSIGLLFSIPLVIGAYLGNWLDSRLPGFSTSWTVSLIITGVFVGAFNVYFYIRDTGDK